jgi:hypothetical protein
MLERLRPRRPSHATVVAYLALFVALGGTSAYAVNEWTGANIVDESLTGADVQGKAAAGSTPAVNGSLTTHDIAGQQANSASGTPFIDGTLTQWDIKNGTVTGGDLAGNTVAAADIATNGVGASEIATGAVGGGEIVNAGVGAGELAPLVLVSNVTSVPANGGVGSTAAFCPAGSYIIGGGTSFAFPSGDISATRLHSFGGGWFGQGQNNGNQAQDLRVEVYCVQAASQGP